MNTKSDPQRTAELWAMLEQGSKDYKLGVYRGPNRDARHDGDYLIPLPPVDGMPYLSVGVFPETLKDLKTLDDSRASACMTCYGLNGPENVNMQLDIEAKRRLIANYIGPIPLCTE